MASSSVCFLESRPRCDGPSLVTNLSSANSDHRWSKSALISNPEVSNSEPLNREERLPTSVEHIPLTLSSLLLLTTLLALGCNNVPPTTPVSTHPNPPTANSWEPAFEPLPAGEVQLSPATTNESMNDSLAPATMQTKKAQYVEPKLPPVEVIRSGSPASQQSTPDLQSLLQQRLSRLVSELDPYRGREETKLSDGERLRKHQIVQQLLCVHGLLADNDLEYLGALLEAMKDPHLPGTRYQLAAAAFFHEIGREDLRDQMMNRMPTPHANPTREASTRPELAQGGFDFRELHICREVLAYGRYDAYERKIFARDQHVHVYGELEQLGVETKGGQLRCGIKMEVFLEDDDGRRVDSRILSDNDWIATSSDAPIDTHLCREYAFPLSIDPGNYRFLVAVTDLSSGEIRRQSLDVELIR